VAPEKDLTDLGDQHHPMFGEASEAGG